MQSPCRTFPSAQRSFTELFSGHTYFTPTATPSLASDSHSSVLHFWNFIISRLLYKRYNTVWNLLRLTFFFPFQHNSLEINPSRCTYQQFVLFYIWAACHGTMVWLHCRHLNRSTCWSTSICVVSTLRLSWIKPLQTFGYRFLCGHKLSFIWECSSQKFSRWVLW